MLSRITALISAAALLLNINNVPMALLRQESTYYNEYITEIVEYVEERNAMDGLYMTEDQIQMMKESLNISAQNYSEDLGISLDEAIQLIYTEVFTEASETVSSPENSVKGGVTRDYPDSVILPPASKEAIFFMDTNFTWNHVGIYENTYFIVEAMPSDGVQFWVLSAPGAIQENIRNATDNASCVLIVSTTDANKNAAAAWPYANITAGTPYDWDFVDNKSDTYYAYSPYLNTYVAFPESDAYNCSELVWKAYKKSAAGIDLDSDGGLGVYPNDIYNSSLTSVTQLRWWE